MPLTDTFDTEQDAKPDEKALRPVALEDFTGQKQAVLLLRKTIAGANSRNEAPDHTLISGPPGLGKTTLAGILASETGGQFRTVMGPSVGRAGDLASVLVSIAERDVLFIDEIHRLPAAAAEMIYAVMEDFRLDILAGDGSRTQAVSIPIPRFCLVGATTRPGMMSKAFRDRFSIKMTLKPYNLDEMITIIERSVGILGMSIGEDVARIIAERSRRTPRIANSFLRRIRDHAAFTGEAYVNSAMSEEVFDSLGINSDGLNESDVKYLHLLEFRYRGGPVGLKTIAAALEEDTDTVEHDIEPWLIRQGYIERTSRGRVLSGKSEEGFQRSLDL